METGTRVGEWQPQALGDLVGSAGGRIKTGPFGSQLHAFEYTDDPGGVPVVMPKDMNNGRIDRDSVSRVSEDVAERLRAHRLAAGDLVLARRGDVGRLAFVESDEAGWLCGTGSMRIHAPDHGVLDPLFLRYAMSAPSVAQWFVGQAIGATMPNLNAKIVSSVPIPAPEVGAQRRIAAVLSVFDELIEINERRIELLEDLARSLYREWFVHFRFPGHERAECIDAGLGKIPNDWSVYSFSAIAEFLNGFAFKPSHHQTNGLPIIKIKELKLGVTDMTPRCDPHDFDSKYLIASGDLLFSWSADLGVYLWPGEPGALNQHLFKVTAADGVPPSFIFHSLKEALPQFTSRAQGTTMRHIKRSALTEVVTVMPASRLLARFDALVEPMHSQVVMLSRLNSRIATIRDLLLPRLVTGRLDIADIDLGILEPAEIE